MVDIITFGCRLNFYESEIIKNAVKKADRQDVIVINSCAVTNEAERQVKQAIRKAYRENPDKKIIVAGCAAQLHPEEYNKMPEVSQVLGNEEKLSYKSYLEHNTDVDITDDQEILVPNFQERSRAFVQVQNGCNHDCTFCCITHARGNNKSVPIANIVSQVQTLIDNDHQEIVLTGVDITDFGGDLPGQPSLGAMIKRLLNTVPQLQRLRLSSIDVAEIDDELFQLIINEERLMPHIHISAQSGDNMILKRMKRRHNRNQVIDFCQEVRNKRPEVVFGADIIAGFPTETDHMFENTYDMINKAGITYLHVFPYSSRSNTPAARMPQVDNHIKKHRAKVLRDFGKNAVMNFYQQQIGSEQEVILEKDNYGRSRNFAMVKIENIDSNTTSSTFKVKITNNNVDRYLVGAIC